MYQLFQSLSTGETELIDIPAPELSENNILIDTRCSLLSTGTERMILDFSKSNYLEKALKQPERVSEVVSKIKTDGLFSTIEAVNSKLNQPIPLGYCNAGEVIAIGKNVTEFKVGDRVVSNGPHAEIVSVSKNLCAKIPKDVSFEKASFSVLASIGLQGIRLAKPNFGETFIVSGLGLIGLMTAQLLKANGCDVIGIDPDLNKCKLAEKYGVITLTSDNESSLSNIYDLTEGIGVDGVIISASTDSNSPVEFAAKACRKRARIILVGVVGLDLERKLFYEKEIKFQVSCSYGPGRYDPNYELKGNDYPIGYVRWTEQRNFQSVLKAIENNSLKVDDLITTKFKFREAIKAYHKLLNDKKSIAIILDYEKNRTLNERTKAFKKKVKSSSSKEPVVSFIGCGNYASRVLIPAFKKCNVDFESIAARNGLNPIRLAKKYGFHEATTELSRVFDNQKCNTIVIATHHNSHGELVLKGLENNMNIFVEKPLCLNSQELEKILNCHNDNSILMVGFNRRFSPLIQKLNSFLKKENQPKTFIYKCNAGFIDKSSWIQDDLIGGGRLIGECCHFIDLVRYLANSKFESFNIIKQEESCSSNKDTFSIQIKFRNGSIAIINYLSNGSKSYQKETLEVFSSGNVYQLNNFRNLKIWSKKGYKKINSFLQNKGNNECVQSFINSIIEKKNSPIPFEEIYEVQELMLKLNQKLI